MKQNIFGIKLLNFWQTVKFIQTNNSFHFIYYSQLPEQPLRYTLYSTSSIGTRYKASDKWSIVY